MANVELSVVFSLMGVVSLISICIVSNYYKREIEANRIERHIEQMDFDRRMLDFNPRMMLEAPRTEFIDSAVGRELAQAQRQQVRTSPSDELDMAMNELKKAVDEWEVPLEDVEELKEAGEKRVPPEEVEDSLLSEDIMLFELNKKEMI